MSARRTLSLASSWRFHLGGEGKPFTDIDAPLANTHIAAYMNNKAGYARGPAKTNFDDSDWRTVDLPHDWSVEGEFNPENHMDAGYLPRGVGWYRKYFRLDESDRGKHIELSFDGIATHSTVYVNGHLLRRNFCGSTPFTIDISDVATFGRAGDPATALNTIAVKVDANWMEGWWYEGAGIYRNVELVISGKTRFERDTAWIRSSRGTDGKWRLLFSVHTRTDPHHLELLQNYSKQLGKLKTPKAPPFFAYFRSTLLDMHGAVVCERMETKTTWLDKQQIVGSFEDLENITAWSTGSPHLYTLRVEWMIDDQLIDTFETNVGFRTTHFDPNTGFFLNGQHTFLNGVCLHQDHAGVGVAVPESIERFRLLQLKSIGVNAIRCAHNPSSKTFFDLCDELGLLVMNELRNFGSSPEHLQQLEAVVRRDRNHASIILWSICNEEAIQGSPVAANIARSMVTRLRELDSTRPITGAVSGALLDDFGVAANVQAHPIASMSGCPGAGTPDPRPENAGQRVPCPGAPGVGDLGTFDVMSINYNLPLHDAYYAKHPHVPMIVSETGCTYATRGITQTDSTKHHFAEDDTAFAPWGATARATWEHIRARPYLAGMFVWTGIDYRGEPTPHEWPSVQSHWGLFDLCAFPKRAARLHESFFTGRPERAAPPRATELTLMIPEVMRDLPILADGEFTLPITIASPIDEPITIEIEGAARLIGVGNGDPTSHVNKGHRISTFNGLAQALVQMTDTHGPIVLRASSHSGAVATLSISSIAPAHPRPSMPVVFPRHLVTGWRMSPITPGAPDPDLVVSDQDMNTWDRIDPARGPQSAWTRAAGFALYRARLTLPKALQARGCTIRFHRVLGGLEVFVDGAPISVRSVGNESAEVDCPPSAIARSLTLRIRSDSGPAGLAGAVELVKSTS